LAPERALGDAALAAVRRGAPVLAAALEPRRGLALAARRHAHARRPRARARVGSAGPGTRPGGAVEGPPGRAQPARAAAVARTARADAGPPVAAHPVPLAAPERDPRQRARDLRGRQPRGVPDAAALGALAAADLPAER